MDPSLFMYHCDPVLEYEPASMLALVNLHCLLSPEPVIQDTFFISALFEEMHNVSPNLSFPDLIQRGCLNIAFRENVASFSHLKDILWAKTLNKEFHPFPLESKTRPNLYQEQGFNSYIQRLDHALTRRSEPLLRWKTSEAAAGLRTALENSFDTAECGPEIAKKVFQSVDLTAQTQSNGQHTRSLYREHAKNSFPQFEAQIMSWVTRHYLLNLPNLLSLGASFPREWAHLVCGSDPFPFLEDLARRNSEGLVLKKYSKMEGL